jgi:PHD/YefM family antitoxin component YafN of YafNO toxin-antitoxin module
LGSSGSGTPETVEYQYSGGALVAQTTTNTQTSRPVTAFLERGRGRAPDLALELTDSSEYDPYAAVGASWARACTSCWYTVGMAEPVLVSPVFEARKGLSAVLSRFRREGAEAAPVVLGAHRSPEGVLMSYERYRAIMSELEDLRAVRERLEAHVEAVASARLEGEEPDSSSHLVEMRVTLGELSDAEALTELDRHFGHPRDHDE